jgi:hypothetical protein
MNWNIKKFNACRRSAVVTLVVVMGVHIFSGWGLFCTNETLRSFRALGIASSGHDRGEVSGSGWDIGGTQGGSPNCCCKKHKKCPAIPRAAITSNPTQRFNEVQRQFKSVGCNFLVSHPADYRLVTGSGPPLMELAWCSSLYSSSSLALTCVLLI